MIGAMTRPSKMFRNGAVRFVNEAANGGRRDGLSPAGVALRGEVADRRLPD
jgi:hypothetical protein